MNQAQAQERTKHSHADFNVEKTNLMLIPSEILCAVMSTSNEILLTVIGIISNLKIILPMSFLNVCYILYWAICSNSRFSYSHLQKRE